VGAPVALPPCGACMRDLNRPLAALLHKGRLVRSTAFRRSLSTARCSGNSRDGHNAARHAKSRLESSRACSDLHSAPRCSAVPACPATPNAHGAQTGGNWDCRATCRFLNERRAVYARDYAAADRSVTTRATSQTTQPVDRDLARGHIKIFFGNFSGPVTAFGDVRRLRLVIVG